MEFISPTNNVDCPVFNNPLQKQVNSLSEARPPATLEPSSDGSFQPKPNPEIVKSVRWIGLAHGSEVKGHAIDNFGLSNGHRLKFRSNIKHKKSKGSSDSMPMILVMCSGDPQAPKPYETGRTIVRELTQAFRRDSKAMQFEDQNFERWLKFEFSEIRKQLLDRGSENSDYLGASASCTCVIIDKGIASVAQLGDTHLFHFRANKLKQLSEGDFEDLVPENYQLKLPYIPKENAKFFRKNTIGILHEDHIEPLLFRIQLQKNDILHLCTEGTASIIGGDRIQKFLSGVKNGDDLENVAMRIYKRGSELSNDKSIGSLLLQIR